MTGAATGLLATVGPFFIFDICAFTSLSMSKAGPFELEEDEEELCCISVFAALLLETSLLACVFFTSMASVAAMSMRSFIELGIELVSLCFLCGLATVEKGSLRCPAAEVAGAGVFAFFHGFSR